MKFFATIFFLLLAASLLGGARAAPAAEGLSAENAAAFKSSVLMVEETGQTHELPGFVATSFDYYAKKPFIVRQISVTAPDRTRTFGVGFRDGARFIVIFDLHRTAHSRVFLADQTGQLQKVLFGRQFQDIVPREPTPEDRKDFAAQATFWIDHIRTSAAGK